MTQHVDLQKLGMQIVRSVSALYDLIQIKKATNKIAFIPTMGSLHEGHLSLIREAKRHQRFTVCSIFVNPTQFNDPKDFELYPRNLDADIQLLGNEICDLLFLPSVTDIYPEPQVIKHYDLGTLENVLEGAHRPGHFQGVCMVVERLLELVMPDELYLGKKDFQQCQVIEKLLEINNQTDSIRLIKVDTVREQNGLAMSSRNQRLSANAREQASIIFVLMQDAKEKLLQGASVVNELLDRCRKSLLDNSFEAVDYFELVYRKDLSKADQLQVGHCQIVVAAIIEGVRLIDNIEI